MYSSFKSACACETRRKECNSSGTGTVVMILSLINEKQTQLRVQNLNVRLLHTKQYKTHNTSISNHLSSTMCLESTRIIPCHAV